MDTIEKVFILRKTEIFSSLPAETLLAIAEEVEVQDMYAREVMYEAGQAVPGLYIIAAGQVKLTQSGVTLMELEENDVFGLIGLLGEENVEVSAMTESDGVLLFIDRDIFSRIAEDLPEVMRVAARVVVRYLQRSLASHIQAQGSEASK